MAIKFSGKEHADVLKRLKESIETYQASDMVKRIRGL